MSFGKYTYGIENITARFCTDHQIKTGSFCSFGKNIKIYLGGNHRTDWVTTYPFGHIYKNIFTTFNGEGHPISKGDIIIGNDVWIGDNVTIMSGINIGDGVVIANNSHIVKDIDSYSIVGGNPAQFIKYRFSSDQIQKLLKIQWWNWDDKKINENLDLICNINIDNFIEKHYN